MTGGGTRVQLAKVHRCPGQVGYSRDRISLVETVSPGGPHNQGDAVVQLAVLPPLTLLADVGSAAVGQGVAGLDQGVVQEI